MQGRVLDLRERVPRVLVVDDDVVVSTLLAIESPGLIVDEVSRARAVPGAIAQQLPDVVIVDRWLPDGDGLDVVRRLRCTPPTQQVPVLVAVGDWTVPDEALALHAGADGSLRKPLDSAAVVAAVRGLLALAPGTLRGRRLVHLEAIERGRLLGLDDLPDVHAPVADAAGWRWWRRQRGSSRSALDA